LSQKTGGGVVVGDIAAELRRCVLELELFRF
jgi:hypothetical protein